ncbi:MAG: PTS sugar transporter subunit IIA [Olsenella sp.]|jgi:mannose/fructose-specific phosphotransferase system component IIA|nr:PTS sugar transporter subunit IIA [Olsenella sp.]MCI1645339.1 PTS sugar transporter subunit IIA [Olsenella sp.]MCI1792528.1 PTS sugar transporter subunit IIA [Olsenella sp.]MCI1811065.1 PTS sugar transporter subunit IIA [Olsenella sp.]MCI1879203.1 PTS sugar transporter subunit IIA [Olsenella sp.]
MEKRVVLVSHDGLAKGVLGAATMICGKIEGLSSFGLEPDGSVVELGEKVRKLALDAAPEQVIVIADLLGGSVCNQCLQALSDVPNVTVLAGMSLPLVLSIVSRDGALSVSDIDEAIAEATCVTKRVSLEAAPEEGEEDFFA